MITDNPHADFDRHQASLDAAEEAQDAALETLRYEMRGEVERIESLLKGYENDHGPGGEFDDLRDTFNAFKEQAVVIEKGEEA